MASNYFGNIYRWTTFGESHGDSIGVVIDGIPSGIKMSLEVIQEDLNKRKPSFNFYNSTNFNNLPNSNSLFNSNNSSISPHSTRDEDNDFQIISGLSNEYTIGSPITIVIKNRDVKNKDYENIKNMFRPSHSDYTYYKKYNILENYGGGRSSGRETACRVLAGSIAKQILLKYIEDLSVVAGVISIGDIKIDKWDNDNVYNNPIRTPDTNAVDKMLELIEKIKNDEDSIGGVIECHIKNIPAGIGEPIYDKLDSTLSYAIMGIGGVKGIEFGLGFESSKMRGSIYNKIRDANGGIDGGISNGKDILFRVSIKPTPSIKKEQTIISNDNELNTISIEGRHDICIAPRVVPVIESISYAVLLDLFLMNKALK